MTALALSAPLTLDDFLLWEERQPERYELVGGVVRLMAGGTEGHDRIAVNLMIALGQRLRGSRCSVHASNLKVVSPAAEASMYPDAFVRCGPRDDTRTRSEDPILVVEVLSPSTAQYDLIRKRLAYEAIPGLRRILYVATDEARIDMRVRGEDGIWRDEVREGLDAALDLPDLDVQVPLAEVYEGSDVARRREDA